MRSETRTRAWALLASLLLGAPGALAQPGSAPGVVGGPRRGGGAMGTVHTMDTLQQRVHTYRDHLERTARRVTLQDALAMGLAQNPVLAKAYAVITSTAWNGVAIRREWLPSLTAGNNDPGLVGVQQQQANTLSISSPELTLEWTFFDPSRHPRAQANAASEAADRFLFDVQARSLVLAIQQQYIDLQTLLELEGEYRQLSTLVEGWRTLAKTQGRRGASTPDVDQLTAQELALLILRIDTHEQVIVAASNLARSLSLPPGDLVMPRDPLVLGGRWGLSRRDTIAQALQFREEIQQSLANARALSWSALATRAGYRPTLSLEGAGSAQGNSDNTDLQSEATVGVNVAWTLFDGGILAAKARSQRDQQEQALQQAALDRLMVTAEVETSHAAYLNSQIVMDASLAQVMSARAAVAAATRGFTAGSSDATTLLQVLGNLRGAVEAYCRALQKHNKSVAALYRTSAQWPEAAPPLVRQRLSNLQSSGPPQSPPGR